LGKAQDQEEGIKVREYYRNRPELASTRQLNCAKNTKKWLPNLQHIHKRQDFMALEKIKNPDISTGVLLFFCLSSADN
jgi:hypothetical protein